MEKIKIVRTFGKRPLVFNGKLILKVKENSFLWICSKTYYVYKTEYGKYICVIDTREWCIIENIRDRIVSQPYENLNDIVYFFRQGKLQDKLYAELGVINEEVIK